MTRSELRSSADESLELACVEVESNRSGTFAIRDDDLRLDLLSFGSPFNQDAAATRLLKLENGQYATLLDCLDLGVSRTHGRDFIVWKQHTRPHSVILGPRVWTSSDRVRSFQFTFYGADTALFYRGHLQDRFKTRKGRGPIDIDVVDHGLVQIVAVQCGDICVKFWMSVRRGGGRIDPQTESTPTVSIEFRDKVTLDEAIKVALNVLSFFELSLGRRSRMRRVVIGQLSETEISEHVERHGDYDEFQVRQHWGNWKPGGEPPYEGDIIFSVWDEAGRGATRANVASWLARADRWKDAYALLSGYLSSTDVYSRDRLLRLLAWFEAIPLHQEQSGLSAKDIQALACAVQAEAEHRQLEISSERISQVLRELQRVPLRARLANAVEANRRRFGASLIPSEMEEDCLAAIRYRNKAAHDSMPLEKEDLDDFARAIHAVELVCAMSMVRDLDVATEKLCPIRSHPLLTYWLEIAARSKKKSEGKP